MRRDRRAVAAKAPLNSARKIFDVLGERHGRLVAAEQAASGVKDRRVTMTAVGSMKAQGVEPAGTAGRQNCRAWAHNIEVPLPYSFHARRSRRI